MRGLWTGLGLLALLHAVPAEGGSNFCIVYYEESWASALQPLAEARETLDYDHESGRAWEVELRSLSWLRQNFQGADTTRLKSYIAQRRATCQGDLFVLIVGDAADPYEAGQPELNHFGMRYIYDPEIGGEELGWSDYVSTDDLYADADGSAELEVCVGRLAAHSTAEVEAYVQKDLFLLFNQQWSRAGHPAGTSRLDSPLPGVGADPVLEALYRRWATAADLLENAAGAPGERGLPYLNYVDILAEDVDRSGRNGWLVREHGEQILDIWNASGFDAHYSGDPAPYDYYAREALADLLDNGGHQVKLTLGTLANRSNNVNFQHLGYGWDPEVNLEGNLAFPLHIGVSCDLGDIDMVEGEYGRPYAERTLLVADRGSFAVIAPTRTAGEFPHFWMGSELSERIVSGTQPGSQGTCVGRVWRDAKNALIRAYPMHMTEWRSYICLGDPTARLVPPPGQAVWLAENDPPAWPFVLSVSPNPFNPEAEIRFTSAGGAVSLNVYDVQGRLVKELLMGGAYPAGPHSMRWNGKDGRGSPAASGTYYLRLEVKDESRTQKVVLLK